MIPNLLDQLGPSPLYNRDFLLSWELDERAIRSTLLAAQALREIARRGISLRLFESGMGYSIFRDKSTRTRYAFKSGCNLLGLATEELSEETSQLAHGETVRETAAMLSFLTETVGIRDDMFLGQGHTSMVETAASIQESFEQGVLMQRPSVLNLQCDLDHPTQALADLGHLVDHFGSLEALRGKKLAMTWAYSPSYGKPLSVPQGIIALMTR
ncbi:MAG: knotted carbamoyltransferase YgeW, partial [Candidatus Eremiobacteraeota bacterium]|nr:knotted carbamoyltransferase YgeW [Candidatus Eremiobacteraeota bacterium]